MIESLSKQMYENSPNVGRAEHRTEDGQYFTIAVDSPPEKPPKAGVCELNDMDW